MPFSVQARLRREFLCVLKLGAPVFLLVVMAGRLVDDVRTDSLTVDEPVYIQSGVCALTERVIDVDPSSPPIFKLLSAAGVLLLAQPAPAQCQKGLPDSYEDWATGSVFATNPAALHRLTVSARIPMISMALLLAVVVFLWARALYGYVASLLALAIVSFEPTLLGHAHLVTGDLSLTFGLTICLAAHWRWTQTRRRRWLLIAGVGFGWALLSKVSALEIVPVLAIIEVAFGNGSPPGRVRQAVVPLLALFATAWGVVCLVYLPFVTAWGQYRWAAPFSWFAPPQWFDSLSYQFRHVQTGHAAYLNGQFAPAHGFWSYFFEAVALKTTLALLLLAAAGAILTVIRRERVSLLYFWLPITAIMLTATVGGIDIGVRYVLPVYPLMAVAAGVVVTAFGAGAALRRAAVAVALSALALASFTHAPNDIGYFNELAGTDPAHYLSDSNLDWGQDAWRLKTWWESNGRPAIAADYFGRLPLQVYGVSSTSIPPAPGSDVRFLAVSVQNMTTASDMSLLAEDALAPFDRQLLALEPAARIGTSIRVYQAAVP
jgi:hypothetical protein